MPEVSTWEAHVHVKFPRLCETDFVDTQPGNTKGEECARLADHSKWKACVGDEEHPKWGEQAAKRHTPAMLAHGPRTRGSISPCVKTLGEGCQKQTSGWTK
jgi:hypothetical protein